MKFEELPLHPKLFDWVDGLTKQVFRKSSACYAIGHTIDSELKVHNKFFYDQGVEHMQKYVDILSDENDKLRAEIFALKNPSKLQEVVDFIKVASAPEYPRNDKQWCWTKNSQCKYVELVIDMRDGEFSLLDRDRHKISLEELKRQL